VEENLWLIWLQRQDFDRVVSKASNHELGAEAALRHFTDVDTLDLDQEEFGLDLIQQARVLVKLKVDDLATLDVDDDLARVGAGHEDAALVGLPLGASTVLASALDLDQTATCHLNENVSVKKPAMER